MAIPLLYHKFSGKDDEAFKLDTTPKKEVQVANMRFSTCLAGSQSNIKMALQNNLKRAEWDTLSRLTLAKPMEIDGKLYLVEKIKFCHPKKEVELIWLMDSVSGAQK